MDYFNGSRAVTRVKAGKARKQGLYELSRSVRTCCCGIAPDPLGKCLGLLGKTNLTQLGCKEALHD